LRASSISASKRTRFAAALKGVVAQRLLRRLCPVCRSESTDPVSERVRRWLPHGMTLYNAVGCAECSQTGYRGRMAVMEVLTANAETERLVSEGATADAIAESARTAGMKTLWDSGIEHVRAGETSLDELLRVVEPPIEIPVRRPQPSRDKGGEPTGNRSDDRGRAPSQTPSRNGVTKPASLPDEALQLLDDLFDETFNARKTVLLVEDEEPLRRVLRDLLEREGSRWWKRLTECRRSTRSIAAHRTCWSSTSTAASRWLRRSEPPPRAAVDREASGDRADGEGG
jgi:hypothetical protein